MKNYFKDLKIEDQIMLLRAFEENKGATEKIIEINNELDSNGCRKDFLFGFTRMINLEQSKKKEILEHIINEYNLTKTAEEKLRYIVEDKKSGSELLFKIEGFFKQDIEVDSCFVECVYAAYKLKHYSEEADIIEEANNIAINAGNYYKGIVSQFDNITDFYNEVCRKIEKIIENSFFEEKRDEA